MILHGLEHYEHLERPDSEIMHFLSQNIRDQEVYPANHFRRKAGREQRLVSNSIFTPFLLLPGCDRASKGMCIDQA